MIHFSTKVRNQTIRSSSKSTPNKVIQNNNDTPNSVDPNDTVNINDRVKRDFNNRNIYKMNYHIHKFPILLQNTYDALIDLRNSQLISRDKVNRFQFALKSLNGIVQSQEIQCGSKKKFK